jgi:methyl-accepting chemotaxis protein
VLNRQSVRTKLILGFGIVIVLTCALAIVGMVAINSLRANTETIANQGVSQLQLSKQLQFYVRTADDYGAWYILSVKPSDITEYQNRYNQNVQAVAQTETAIRQLSLTVEQMNALADFDKHWSSYLTDNNSAFKLYQQGNQSAAAAQYIVVPADDIIQSAQVYVDLVTKMVSQQRDNAQSTGTTSMMFICVVGISTLIISIACAWLIANSLSTKITRLIGVARRISYSADPGIRAKVIEKTGDPGHDELGQLVVSFGEMATIITNLSCTLNDGAGQVSEAAGQVTQAINQVAQGAQDQAAQLVSANHEIDMVSNQSKELQETSLETMRAMENVKTSVTLTAEKIRRLGERSQEIGLIVRTIDEVAEQTNLLALNAAIEAARAGEHGRGFAVVADEVRKLAERSAVATKDIAKMINETQQDTCHAVEAMEQGVVEVEKAFGHVAATEQQAQNMSERTLAVNHAISSVASVAEENGSSAEEVSAATEEVTAQTEEVVSAANEMADMAENLEEGLRVFYRDPLYQPTQHHGHEYESPQRPVHAQKRPPFRHAA